MPVTIRSPHDATRIGIAYVTADRRGPGLVMPMSIAANISLPTLKRYLTRLGVFRTRDEVDTAEEYRKRIVGSTASVW